MPRPEIQKHEAPGDKICAECDHFTFRTREHNLETPGWAFCRKRNNWFSRQGPELTKDDPEYLPAAGMRTCGYWE